MRERYRTRMWLGAIAIFAVAGCSIGGPYNRIVNEIPIPDRGTKVVVFQRGAGTASESFAMVSLQPADHRLRDSELGNLFRGRYMDVTGVDVSGSTINIHVSGRNEDVLLEVVRYYGYEVRLDVNPAP